MEIVFLVSKNLILTLEGVFVRVPFITLCLKIKKQILIFFLKLVIKIIAIIKRS